MNGVWIMGIDPGEPKRTFFLREPLFQVFTNSMHSTVHHGAHEYLRMVGLKQEYHSTLH